MKPPVVGLLSDFGLADGYVAVMQAIILARCPLARLIDITHAVPAQAVRVAALRLRRAWPYFAPASTFLAVVDPGVGSSRGILLARHAGHTFIAPDNGLLPAALPPTAKFFTVTELADLQPGPLSRTFHGRDLFAPLAAWCAAGGDPQHRSDACPQPLRLAECSTSTAADGSIHGQILDLDHFGNAITSIVLPPAARGHAHCAGRDWPLAESYAAAGPGAALSIIGSENFLELSIANANAARAAGLARGQEVTWWPGDGLLV